ncbi:hypothetical protein KFE25_002776 [Diacronema lutheri]|uniref:Uncharacterized protein n=2 Tax=Diacronema lutheri TaxID=2081491 RepID=A0A8J5XRX4_DIALT|nr:hypothetical protein KFE25_002776 [Diacronema lutheri]
MVALDPISAELCAGGIGGACGVFIGQPFDFIKVRLQSLGTAYTGPFDCLRKTIRHEGILGVYRGILPPVLNSFVLNAIMFGGFGHGHAVVEGKPWSRATKSFLAGSYAGLISVSALVPFDLVKCQMQVDRAGGRAATFRNSSDCARAILRAEGIAGMYRGSLVTVARDSPTTGAYFVAYEALEHHLPRLSPALVGEPATFFAGGLSGMLAWLLAYPLDTVKTHLQALPLSSRPNERTIEHAVRTIHARHGAAFFFRGLGTCLMRAFPVNSVTFVVYKRLRGLLA